MEENIKSNVRTNSFEIGVVKLRQRWYNNPIEQQMAKWLTASRWMMERMCGYEH